jgi:hypothetical protein
MREPRAEEVWEVYPSILKLDTFLAASIMEA